MLPFERAQGPRTDSRGLQQGYFHPQQAGFPGQAGQHSALLQFASRPEPLQPRLVASGFFHFK